MAELSFSQILSSPTAHTVACCALQPRGWGYGIRHRSEGLLPSVVLTTERMHKRGRSPSKAPLQGLLHYPLPFGLKSTVAWFPGLENYREVGSPFRRWSRCCPGSRLQITCGARFWGSGKGIRSTGANSPMENDPEGKNRIPEGCCVMNGSIWESRAGMWWLVFGKHPENCQVSEQTWVFPLGH